MLRRCEKRPAMASIVEPAEKQKSFGSFLQKRTRLSYSTRRAIACAITISLAPAGMGVTNLPSGPIR